MSANYNTMVMTTAGLNLLARVQAEQTTMSITRIAAGSGTYTDKSPAALKACTALKAQVQSFIPASYAVAGSTKVKIRVLFNNDGLANGYYMNELGVFAADGGGTEVLYAIAVCSGDVGEYMMSAGSGSMDIWKGFVINVANGDETSVEIMREFFLEDTHGLVDDPGTVVQAQDLMDEMTRRMLDAEAYVDGTTLVIPLEAGGKVYRTSMTDVNGLLGSAGAEVDSQNMINELSRRAVNGSYITAKRKSCLINSPSASSAHTGYGYAQTFAWQGVKSTYDGNVAIVSGSYSGDMALETEEGRITLYFSDDPTGITVNVYIYPSDERALP